MNQPSGDPIPDAPLAGNDVPTKVNPFSRLLPASSIASAGFLMDACRSPQPEILHAPLGQPPENRSRDDEATSAHPDLADLSARPWGAGGYVEKNGQF